MKHIDVERKAIDICNKLDSKHSLLANYMITDNQTIIFHTRHRRMSEYVCASEVMLDDFMIMHKEDCVWQISKHHTDELLKWMNLK